MHIKNLYEILKNEPKYREKQIKTAIFQELIEDWSEATTLPLVLREKLKKGFDLSIRAKTFFSNDKKTAKALIRLNDGLAIEAVLMRHKDDRNTVCVSSQAGCPLKCAFCATGQMGFKRNLDAMEIIEQVLFFARYLKKIQKKITNVVFMGMGEPFLNTDNVFEAIKILNDKKGFNLGMRHFSISTIGITEGINELAGWGSKINLAVSLHAPNDKIRAEIIPIAQKYPMEEIIKALKNYIKKTNRRVMIEYIMMKGINDSLDCAAELAEAMKKIPLSFVNLIAYNQTGAFRASESLQIKKFREVLEKKGISVTQRYKFGQDIDAACGQLAVKSR